jgi:hypothetical protein
VFDRLGEASVESAKAFGNINLGMRLTLDSFDPRCKGQKEDTARACPSEIVYAFQFNIQIFYRIATHTYTDASSDTMIYLVHTK